MENKIEAIVKEPSLESLKAIKTGLKKKKGANTKRKLEAVECQIKRIEASNQEKDK